MCLHKNFAANVWSIFFDFLNFTRELRKCPMDNNLTRYIIIAVITATILFIAWYFSSIIIYILIAAALSIVAKPLIDLLNRLKVGKWCMPRSLSAVIGLVAVWIVAFLFFYFFIPVIANQMQDLSTLDVKVLGHEIAIPLQGIEEQIQKYVPGAGDFSFDYLVAEQISSVVNQEVVIAMFGSVANLLGNLAIALFSISFITFFFMREEKLFSGGVIILFPTKYEENITRALSEISKLLVRYFVGMFLDVLCVMIILTAGLTFIAGLSFHTSLVIGLVAGVLNVIPYVGPLIGAIFGLVIGGASQAELIASGMMGSLLLRIVLVFLIMKILDDAIFQPIIFSNSIKAHPLEIFLVIMIAGSIGGIFGMLLAIPTYTVIRVFAKEFFNNFRVVQKLTERIN